MKINSSQIDENRESIRKLLQKQRNEIALREQELDNIQQIYKKKEADEKLNGEQQLLDIHDRNQATLIEATKAKEDKLAQMRETYQQTQERLTTQENILKSEHEKKITNAHDEHMIKTRDLFDEAQESIQDINLRNNEKIKDVHDKTNLSLRKIQHKSQLAIDKAAYDNDLKVTEAQNGQADALKQSKQQFEYQKRRQEWEHKNELDKQLLNNQNEFQTRERIYKDKTNATKEHYDNLMKSEKTAFERKYKMMIEDHKKVLDRLKGAFDKRMNELIKGHSAKHQAKETRAQDNFYHLHTLEPKVREDQKFYYLDISTPAHEKENYNVTAHGRKIKLQFNRRTEERFDGPTGEVETSKKSETITKEIRVSDIIDDKELKVAYKDGVLSYRIPKA